LAEVVDGSVDREGAARPAVQQHARPDLQSDTWPSADELRQIYSTKGLDGAEGTIAYCRIGERSSHTWFVLKYVLGQEKIRNYDGSWIEYGSPIVAPIEKGTCRVSLLEHVTRSGAAGMSLGRRCLVRCTDAAPASRLATRAGHAASPPPVRSWRALRRRSQRLFEVVAT
jgi:hypothetical protein